MENTETTIGARKYEALKALGLEDPTEDSIMAMELQFPQMTVAEALKMITNYENKNAHVTRKTIQNVNAYFDRINQPKPEKEIKIMTKEWLLKRFDKFYREQNGVKYSRDVESLENLKPIIYYFLGEFEEFKKCANLSLISAPSMDKGLLIIGGYGVGKSSIMKALQKSLVGTNIPFQFFTANDLVTWYEELKGPEAKAEFHKKTMAPIAYFDDVLTERETSNYGKFNLLKDILEKRAEKGLRTYITCNFKDGSENLKDGLSQFGDKYGGRVYDRIFSMYNVVVFKGKSRRQ